MKSLLLVLLATLQANVALAWTRPQLPVPKLLRPSAESGRKLDYILFEVNGVRRIARSGEELPILRGDRILIKEAYLKDPSVKPKDVQVIGLMHTKSGGFDARGTEFKTRDLASSLSEVGEGKIYAILPRTKNEFHGIVYLKIVEPTLRYAEVTINKKRIILRDGELLKVSAKDLFHLDRIVTNIENQEDVLFQIVENHQGDKAIRFLRQGIPFASIPLVIEE